MTIEIVIPTLQTSLILFPPASIGTSVRDGETVDAGRRLLQEANVAS